MQKLRMVLVVLSVAAFTSAVAQGGGTPEEQAACARDAQRFCRSVIDKGDLAVLACFQQNRAKSAEHAIRCCAITDNRLLGS
jgi:hypothetical protein